MALFARKILVCARCGKKLESRISVKNPLCASCKAALAQKRKTLKGYIDYAGEMLWDRYDAEKLDQIASHWDDILARYSKGEVSWGAWTEKTSADMRMMRMLIMKSGSWPMQQC